MIARNMASDRTKRAWLTLGVVANTGILVSLKYLSAVLGPLPGTSVTQVQLAEIVAPLAISFYTFQQISFLVDVARGKVVLDGLVRYMSFVAFFPTLLAGPITLYSGNGTSVGHPAATKEHRSEPTHRPDYLLNGTLQEDSTRRHHWPYGSIRSSHAVHQGSSPGILSRAGAPPSPIRCRFTSIFPVIAIWQ